MIDDDIRHIIEPELMDGEKLLWAEKTIRSKQDAIVEQHTEDRRLFKIIYYAIMICNIVGMVFFRSYRAPGLVVIILLFMSLSVNIETADTEIVQAKDMDIGGYALSNQRLFHFDKNLKITDQSDASKLKRAVEESFGITLSPVGTDFLKSQHLFFLKNNYATTKFINGQLRRPSS